MFRRKVGRPLPIIRNLPLINYELRWPAVTTIQERERRRASGTSELRLMLCLHALGKGFFTRLGWWFSSMRGCPPRWTYGPESTHEHICCLRVCEFGLHFDNSNNLALRDWRNSHKLTTSTFVNLAWMHIRPYLLLCSFFSQKKMLFRKEWELLMVDLNISWDILQALLFW